MTWNIAAGHGDLSRIADVIRAERPDVLGLQEVDVHWSERSGFADQPADLAKATGMEARFGAIYQMAGAPGAPLREYGLAILSRHPIVAFQNHPIPRLSTQTAETEPRSMPGFLDALIEVRGQRIRVFNTHLDYRADPRVRELQVAAMRDRLRGVQEPVVLVGDLNAPPSAPALAPLFARLTDVWRDARDPGFTYPASRPVRRIDYVLTAGAIRGTAARVVATKASDHRAVIADLVLAR